MKALRSQFGSMFGLMHPCAVASSGAVQSAQIGKQPVMQSLSVGGQLPEAPPAPPWPHATENGHAKSQNSCAADTPPPLPPLPP